MDHNTRFCIVSPAWNCKRWVKRCLKSIQTQTYTNFECVLLDDLSTDGTYEAARRATHGDPRFQIIRNGEKRYPLGNLLAGTRLIAHDPSDVIVVVDGDDWLKHKRVLEHIAVIYRDPAVWLTYGSHEHHRKPWRARLTGKTVRGVAAAYPDDIIRENAYRQHTYLCSHLRTYRKFLWDSIRDEDLRDFDGSYFKAAGDAATMWPMLEMATPAHFRYLDEILYVYNNDHPLSENRMGPSSDQARIGRVLVRMPPYRPLNP